MIFKTSTISLHRYQNFSTLLLNLQLGRSEASLLEGKLVVGADLVPRLILHDLPHLGHRRGGEHVQGVAEEGSGASRL